ncbi:MAG: hypothetical protein VX939_00535 [Pseudomonadota bacterium]|nr:hypothetical protein [Pseudomonadota bacterium]
MQSNKLRVAIRATAAAAIFGVAGQASALELSAGDWKAELYGFARLAAAYDIDQDISAGGRGGNFASIDTSGGDTNDGHFGMDANTSRLGFTATSPEGVKALVEFDFDNNGTLEPRLRRAFGEYKGVLLGQEWSNFNSFVGNPSILDWDNLPGRAGLQSRITQVRYTTGALSFSVEDDTSRNTEASNNPLTPVDERINSGNIAGTAGDKTSMPVFTARFEDSTGGLSYSAAALVKQISYDDTANDRVDDALGFAAFLAGRFAVTDMLTITGSVSFADGASNYIYRSGENFGGFEG